MQSSVFAVATACRIQRAAAVLTRVTGPVVTTVSSHALDLAIVPDLLDRPAHPVNAQMSPHVALDGKLATAALFGTNKRFFARVGVSVDAKRTWA